MKQQLLAIICTSVLIFCISGCSNAKNKPDTESAETTIATKETKPVEITVNDSINGKINLTPSSQVKKSTLNKSCFSLDSKNRITYEDNDTYSVTGIDVSSYSGEINWKEVKNDGIEFAIIRIGGRGYGDSGAIYEDTTAINNIKNAKHAGLDVGVYFYSQAITTEEAVEEAEFVLSQLSNTELDLPIVYDFEFIESDTARTDNITGEEMTRFAKAFCSTVENAGYSSMIYGESHDFYQMYELEKLKSIPLWYAEYNNVPDFYYHCDMWQYSDKGNVKGINGSVDMNLMFIEN